MSAGATFLANAAERAPRWSSPATVILGRKGVRHCLQPGIYLKQASSPVFPP
jgi:hypothetical protein